MQLHYLVNQPSLKIELHDDGTASFIKYFDDGTASRLTRIVYWDADSGRHGLPLNNDQLLSFEDSYHTVIDLLTHGGKSSIYPIREMMPGQPPLGVRIFANCRASLLNVRLGNAPFWVDIVTPEQVFISCKMEPVFNTDSIEP